jgi:succinate dehydrogenase / fumarate reductase membrane anchor subunit
MKERYWWFLFILAAAVILITLAVHMFLMHMGTVLSWIGVSVGDPLAWESTLARNRQIGMVSLLFVLLTAGLFHGLYGLRGILIEWIKNPIGQKVITWLVALFGIVAYAWGLVVLFGVYAKGG